MDVREKQSSEKRLIDANAMRADWLENGENEYVYDTNAVLDSIDSQPTVDAVEVIRCRDCKYHEDTHVTGFEHCCLYDLTMRYNDFCSYGKREEVLTMAEYIENPLSGKLRGVTYEDGKIIDVHIRDTDDVVKVFVPVRHGRWIRINKLCGEYECSVCHGVDSNCSGYYGTHIVTEQNYCPFCGAIMDGGDD